MKRNKNYTDTSIYVLLLDLANNTQIQIKNSPKMLQRTVGERILNLCLDTCSTIRKAYDSIENIDKEKYIKELMGNIKEIEVAFAFAQNTNAIPKSSLGMFSEKLGKLVFQCNNWYNSMSK